MDDDVSPAGSVHVDRAAIADGETLNLAGRIRTADVTGALLLVVSATGHDQVLRCPVHLGPRPERADPDMWTPFTATVVVTDLAAVSSPRPPPSLHVQVEGAGVAPCALTVSPDFDSVDDDELIDAFPPVLSLGVRLAPMRTPDAHLGIEVRTLPPSREVTSVEVGDDLIVVTGCSSPATLHPPRAAGLTPRHGDDELIAARVETAGTTGHDATSGSWRISIDPDEILAAHRRTGADSWRIFVVDDAGQRQMIGRTRSDVRLVRRATLPVRWSPAAGHDLADGAALVMRYTKSRRLVIDVVGARDTP